jgi:hypothetical protein
LDKRILRLGGAIDLYIIDCLFDMRKLTTYDKQTALIALGGAIQARCYGNSILSNEKFNTDNKSVFGCTRVTG